MIWTEEMTDRLKRLWAEGYSASQCAAMLGGVTRHAVLAKCDRLRKRGNLDAPARRDGELAKARSLRERSARSSAMIARKREVEGPKPSWDKYRSKPVPVEPYIERGEPGLTAAAVAKQVTLADLEEHHCRWPVGDPRLASFRFCGCDKVLGLPYCEAHARRAFPLRYPEDHQPHGIAVTGSVVAAGGKIRVGGGVGNPQVREAAPGRSEREKEDA